jgi:hypothetical protein
VQINLSSISHLICVVCRSWQIRKMILTTKYVVFGRVKTGEVIDMIPQHEITNVVSESSTASIDRDDDDEDGYESSAEVSRYVFCIHTIPDGYNSGRMYRIRANSSQNLKMALRNLVTLSRAAAEKAAAKSKFRRTQDKVAKVFNNIWTQRVLAIIIFAVQLSTGIFKFPSLTHSFARILLSTSSTPKTHPARIAPCSSV